MSTTPPTLPDFSLTTTELQHYFEAISETQKLHKRISYITERLRQTEDDQTLQETGAWDQLNTSAWDDLYHGTAPDWESYTAPPKITTLEQTDTNTPYSDTELTEAHQLLKKLRSNYDQLILATLPRLQTQTLYLIKQLYLHNPTSRNVLPTLLNKNNTYPKLATDLVATTISNLNKISSTNKTPNSESCPQLQQLATEVKTTLHTSLKNNLIDYFQYTTTQHIYNLCATIPNLTPQHLVLHLKEEPTPVIEWLYPNNSNTPNCIAGDIRIQRDGICEYWITNPTDSILTKNLYWALGGDARITHDLLNIYNVLKNLHK